MKHISSLFYALFTCLIMAVAVGMALDIGIGAAFLGCAAGSALLSFLPMPQGVAHAVVLKQMWETELVEKFRAFGEFLAGVSRKDQYVGNNVINITEIGADPTVLINNNTYPIAVAQRTDDNIAVALNKYDTTNTKVTDDELYALPYDKEGSVIRQHRDTLNEQILSHALHSLCVAGNTTDTPVLQTTGADDGTGRKRLVPADIIRLQLALDNLKVPQQGRRLVLCPEHCADLLLADLSFALPYHNAKEGMILPSYYGFETYKYVNAPVFNAAGAKKAFGAAGAAGDRKASVVFLPGRSFTANGDLKFYYRDASMDPENRQTVCGYRLWSVTLPVKTTGFGAMISANV